MTALQRLQLEQSRKRQRISELLGLGDELTDEQRAELDTITKRLEALEGELRAAIVAEGDGAAIVPDDDGEARELRQLQSRSTIRNYLAAATGGRGVTGAELEFNQALKMGETEFPLQLLAGDDPELRTTTDTDTQVTPSRWIDRLFAGTAAQALGLTFDTVASGVASYPITLTGGTPAQRGREEAIDNSAWTIGITEIKPTRLGIHYRFAIEDAARIGPGLESALERDMRMALAERLDYVLFAGDDGANENSADIAAITATSGITEKTLAQADKLNGPETLKALVELLDGTHAESLADLKAVAFVGANQLWRSTNIAGSAARPYTMASWLQDAGFSWRTRGGIEDATANGDLAAMLGLSRGLPGAGVVAVWSTGSWIRDPYSGAASGTVQLTLQTLWNYAVVRASNFAKLTFAA